MALEHLKFSKRLKNAKYTLAALESIHTDSLSTFLKIKLEMEDLGVALKNAKSMVDCKYSNSLETAPLQDLTNEVISQSESIIWAVEQYDQIMLAKQ